MDKPIVLTKINQILMLNESYDRDGRNLQHCNLDTIEDGAIVYDESEIIWVGKTTELPEQYQALMSTSLEGYCLTPQVCDSHTHTVFAGNRANEYGMRLDGRSYEEIAKAGGGILASMQATKSASFEDLYDLGKERVLAAYSYGIGAVEIKSGYGLTEESEEIISEVIHKLRKEFENKVQIKNTYLAAHAVPKSFNSSEEYLDKIVIPLLEKLSAKNILDFVDIFHEVGYFDEKDTRKLFDKSKELALDLKIHADEFNDNGGASIAAEYNAVSADHLLSSGEKGITDLSKSETIATMLPGTGFFLGKPQAQARKFLDSGARLSIASDYNPGSCHWQNLVQIAATIAPHENYKLNQVELWSAITLNAAKAMTLENQGAIKVGLKPKFSFFKCNSISEITYNWGKNLAVTKEDLGILS